MKALAGRTVLVTRSQSQAGSLVQELASLGASVLEEPLIHFEAPRDWEPADRAIDKLSSYEWVLFTSTNGVEAFCGRMKTRGVETAPIAGQRIGAVGSATAERLEAHGFAAPLLSSRQRGEGLADLVLSMTDPIRDVRILVPGAEVSRPEPTRRLRQAGAVVEGVVVYRTVRKSLSREVRSRIMGGSVDIVTFTSPSTVHGFFDSLEAVPPELKMAAIGPVTADVLRARGRAPDAVAPAPTARSLAGAIAALYS